MAWGSVGTGGTSVNTANNQASSTHTVATNNLSVGRFGVLIISVDNFQTTDGDENAVSNVTDSAGNTWQKAAEFCNGQGTAQTGATVSVWYCHATAALNAGGTISWDYSNATSRDESCSSLWIFSVGAGATVRIPASGTATLATDGADVGSLDVTTSDAAHLRVHCIAAELNSATQMTATDGNWTLFTNTRSAAVATAMAVYGEHRIATGTSFASNPTLPATADCASVYAAFLEVPSVADRAVHGQPTQPGLHTIELIGY